ncbi:MAG: hypothetical protein J0M25_00590 [Flavobacteriales bacterium]|nr:hypothetical protein [Flavobacteriales bacterium]
MQDPDFEAKERAAAIKAAAGLRAAYRSQVTSTFKRGTGKLQKSTFSSRFREGRLDRLVLSSPHYSFKNHFGSTKKGITPAHTRKGKPVKAHSKNRTYKGYNHIAEALKATNALEQLATDLGQNRAVLITSQINF